MNGANFDRLLMGPLGSAVIWERSYLCPCTTPEGEVTRRCPVCGGMGRVWDQPSTSFRIGVTSMTARALAGIQQRFGPGTTGDATLSIPGCAPCWGPVDECDRFTVLGAIAPVQWSLAADRSIHLPYLATDLEARVLDPEGPGFTVVVPPVPDADGAVEVAVPTVLSCLAPRRYEVVKDLSQVRSYAPGLPKKLLVKLIDWTVR